MVRPQNGRSTCRTRWRIRAPVRGWYPHSSSFVGGGPLGPLGSLLCDSLNRSIISCWFGSDLGPSHPPVLPTVVCFGFDLARCPSLASSLLGLAFGPPSALPVEADAFDEAGLWTDGVPFGSSTAIKYSIASILVIAGCPGIHTLRSSLSFRASWAALNVAILFDRPCAALVAGFGVSTDFGFGFGGGGPAFPVPMC